MSSVDYKLLLKRVTERVEKQHGYRLKKEDWLLIMGELLDEKLIQGELRSTLNDLSIADLIRLKKEIEGGDALKKPRGRPKRIDRPVTH